MNKFFCILLMVCAVYFVEINAQSLKFGLSFLYCGENSTFDTGLGVEPFAEYQINKMFSVRGTTGIHYSEFTGKYALN